MLGVLLEFGGLGWLLLHGVQFAVRQEHGLRGVLVVVGEGVVTLRVVEA